MKQEFAGQVAIVTGGADGLGLAVAKRLRDQGARLALLDFDQKKLQAAQLEFDPNTLTGCVDVGDARTTATAIERILKKAGRIDILINCAGVTGPTNLRSHEIGLADFARVMSVNFFGSLHTSRAVLPHMISRNYGRILHIASIAGKEGNAGMAAYSASKAAVIGLTKSQGKEYADVGITVNALAPAVIRTAIHDTMPEKQFRYMTEKIPMKRCGTKEEFATMAAFIVSPSASFSTAFTFDLSGGRATY